MISLQSRRDISLSLSLTLSLLQFFEIAATARRSSGTGNSETRACETITADAEKQRAKRE